jgi:pyrimidine-nucleoside phosphorylase
MHRTVEIIAKKRDGLELSGDEIKFIVKRHTSGEIADYQMAALVMAIYLRGMTTQETIALTNEMLHSGAVLDFSDFGRPRVDKHSTGGVGDKTSLVIAPVVGAAGVLVPMISGRSLAHSGGTLDKLESIPGFRTDLSLTEFRRNLERVGVALIGQTSEIAPADKKLYALRDVTATVACLPLMAASIMSKKMAEGITGLVLDVKVGSGAFLKSDIEAEELATLMIQIGTGMGKECVGLITNMNQPLGCMIGNSLEVVEALEILGGDGPQDLGTLCRELSAEMLVLGKAVDDVEEGRKRYDELIGSGAALEKLREIIQSQYGDPKIVDNHSLLPQAQNIRTVEARTRGYIESIETESIGRASMLLGAGRTRLNTPIDPSVGLRVEAKIGDPIQEGQPLATVYYNVKEQADEAVVLVEGAFSISSEPSTAPNLIKKVLR